MRKNSKPSNSHNDSKFLYHLEKAVRSIVDESLIDLGSDKALARSHLKRHVQLIVYSQLDRIIKKVLP